MAKLFTREDVVKLFEQMDDDWMDLLSRPPVAGPLPRDQAETGLVVYEHSVKARPKVRFSPPRLGHFSIQARFKCGKSLYRAKNIRADTLSTKRTSRDSKAS